MKPRLRFEVFKRDAFTCVYCGRRSPEVILHADHVLAISQGGRDELDNLVTSCLECNQGKAARSLTNLAPGLNPREKSERIAEHEAQIAEYAHWLSAQRQREDEEVRLLTEAFAKLKYARFNVENNEDGERWDWYWQRDSVRRFVRRLGYHEVRDSIEVCEAQFRPRWRSSTKSPKRAKQREAEDALNIWKYFCGICWRKIKEPNGRPTL